MEEIHYLYKITNLINGKLYIGVTKDPKHRKEAHFSKGERLVNKACKKYGKENLSFEIICVGLKDYIYDLEVEAIKLYNSDASVGHGYNVCSGGFKGDAGNKGRKHQIKSDDVPHYVAGFWFNNRRTALSSLNWKVGKFNSRKKLGVLGEECVLQKRHGPQTSIYVSGFWFPCKKVAISVMNMTSGIFHRRKLDGTIGEVTVERRKSNSTVILKPCYFKGFWFDSVDTASYIFNIRPESIRRRILRGNYEECNSKQKQSVERYSYKFSNDEV